MSTNYYLKSFKANKECHTCGAHTLHECIHIGKSSNGWYFMLHVDPEMGLNTLEDWSEYITARKATHFIADEYNNVMNLQDFLHVVEWRTCDNPPTDPQWYERNQAERGINGLARFRVDGDGKFCTGHKGTCSYITGVFC